jgi:hypothetical protein
MTMAAAATITDHNKLPDEARTTANLIKRLGFNWELDLRYPTPDPSSKRVQIRDEKHYSPTAEVSKYAAAMARGDKFAPIVVTRDGYLLDGNTRSEAARRNKYPDITAFVLDRDWEGAPEQVKRRMHLLGAGFNIRNGRGIDRKEQMDAVLAVGTGTDYDAARIAALLGVSAGFVNGVLSEQKARERAQRLDIHVNGSVPSSQLRRLGQAPLNDEPFKVMLKLTQDAGLSVGEINELIKKVRDAGSDSAALELLTQVREDRKDQIAEYSAVGKSRPAHSSQLRQRLGFVLGFEDNPSALVELNPTLVDTQRDILTRTITVLTNALALQEEKD